MAVTSDPLRGNGSPSKLRIDPEAEPVEQLEQLESSAVAFEYACSSKQWAEPQPAKLREARAYARLLLAVAEFLVEGERLGPEYATRLDEVRDRLEDLIDTLSWGADAHKELGALAEAER